MNKFAFLGLAFLPFGVLALELIVILIESLIYGTMDFSNFKKTEIIIHWICTVILWCFGLLLLNLLSKKIGYNIFENKNKPKLINWIIVGIVVVFSIIGSYIAWEMKFKLIVELNYYTNKYSDIGIALFIVQYIYYFIESMLFLAIVVFAQEFGERTLKNKIIPWGGIMCGLTWGLGHILTKDLYTGLYSLLISIFYGVVYVQLKKNVKYAYIIIALMFMI